MRWAAAAILSAWSCIMFPNWAGADSLASQLDNLLRKKGLQTVDTVVPVLVQSVARAADFPTVATGPDFAYEYRPDSIGFERSVRPLSPVLVETAQTVGRHVLQIGGSSLWTKFNRLDGKLLEHTEANFTFTGETAEGQPLRIPGTLKFDAFTIQDFVFSAFATYGVTDRWDVGLVIPGVFTMLEARGQREVEIDNTSIPLDRFDIDDSKLGIGDVLLRSKYVFYPNNGLSVAPTLALRMPTGNQANFQGTGDTTVTPGLTATHTNGRFGFFASAGVDVPPSDLERTAVRYGTALSFRILAQLSLIAEVSGRSTLVDDTFFVVVPVSPSVPLDAPSPFVRRLPATIPRADAVDGAIGLKARLLPGYVGFVSVIFPLTKGGATAPVTPLAGVEIHF
jgi:hypothetical protein